MPDSNLTPQDECRWAADMVRKMVDRGVIEDDHQTRNRHFWALLDVLQPGMSHPSWFDRSQA